MGSAEWALVWVGVVTIGVMVYGIFAQARQRDAAKMDEVQAKQITDLYDKHDKDASKLAALELQIANNHPDKDTIRTMFADFKEYLDQRFDRLEGIDRRVSK